MRLSGNIICLLLMLQFHSARADIYRCSGASGEPAFSQRPCGSDSTVLVREAPKHSGEPLGIRPSERAWLRKRARSSQPAKQKERGAQVSRAAARRKSTQQVYRCQRKQRTLDAVKAKMRRGYKPAQGDRLRRRQAEYEDYLAAFCP